MDKRAKPPARSATKAGAKGAAKGRTETRPSGHPVSLAAGAPSPWSVPVAVENLPDAGLHRSIMASEAECAEVAKLAGARTIAKLEAIVDLKREGDFVHVSGRVRAIVGQVCIVTLEPIETEVDEPIDVSFAPVTEEALVPSASQADGDPAEPLIDGTVDLGAIAVEFLLLGLDPYPRKGGVEFALPEVADDAPHPFAALAALKKAPNDNKP